MGGGIGREWGTELGVEKGTALVLLGTRSAAADLYCLFKSVSNIMT